MSVNRVTLLGRLGKDPELRNVNGKDVANFSIATSESYKDQQGNKKEATEWHNIVIWGALGKVAATYLKKGDQVYLEGKNRTRSWEKNGTTLYVTEVLVNHMTMIRNKKPAEQRQEQRQEQPVQDNFSSDDLPF